jgi:hypothetical protein
MKTGRVRAINRKRYDRMLAFAREADLSHPEFLTRLTRVGGIARITAEQAWTTGWPREGMPALRDAVAGIDQQDIRAARDVMQPEIPELTKAWHEGTANEHLRSRMDALRTRQGEATMVQVARDGVTDLMEMLGKLSSSIRPLMLRMGERIPQDIGKMLEGPLTVRRISNLIGLLERLARVQAHLAGVVPPLVRAERLVAGAPGPEEDDADETPVSDDEGASLSVRELTAQVQHEISMLRRAHNQRAEAARPKDSN